MDSSGTDRESQIDQVASEVYAAMGIPDRKVASGYERTLSTGCAKELGIEPGLGANKAWYARKAFAVAPGDYDYDALVDDAEQHYVAQGWTVQQYRIKGGARALTALRDEVGVLVTVPSLAVVVTAGPCARSTTAVSPDRYQPVPG